MAKIKSAEVIKDLEAIVASVGKNYNYHQARSAKSDGRASCVYKTDAGHPACIVGHVLARHGLLEGIGAFDDSIGSGRPGTDDFTMECTPRILCDHFTPKALRKLAVAQFVQDAPSAWVDTTENATWGNALEAARAQQ